MSVSSALTYSEHAGNGATTAFSVVFPFIANAHLVVNLVDANGTVTLQTAGVHYNYGSGDPCSQIIFVTPPPTGTTVRIDRDTPKTQTTNLVVSGTYQTATIQAILDRYLYIIQETYEEVSTNDSRLSVIESSYETTLQSYVDLAVAAQTAAEVAQAAAEVAEANAAISETNAAASEAAAAASAAAAAASAASIDLAAGITVGDAGTEGSGINISGTTYESTFKVSDIDGTNYAQTILHRHSTVLEPLIVGARSNSNTSAHSDVTANQSLFSVFAAGWQGTNYKLFAALKAVVSTVGTLSSTSSIGKWLFQTTPDGAVVPETALIIESDKSADFKGNVLVQADKLKAAAGVMNLTPAAGTTVLTASSPSIIYIDGATTWQDIRLPDPATCYIGQSFTIANRSNYFMFLQYPDLTYGPNIYDWVVVKATCIAASGSTYASWKTEYMMDGNYNSVYSLRVNGGRVYFPATANPSTDVNCLDDYEEGSFTPTIYGLSTAGTGTYANNYGTYVKIGKMVYFQIVIIWTAHTGTGNMQVAGLPFTCGGQVHSFSIGNAADMTLTAGYTPFSRSVLSSTDIMITQESTGGGADNYIAMDTAARIYISGCYTI